MGKGNKIDNFGQVATCSSNLVLFRSGHINKDQYQELQMMKIGTVINLQAEDDDRANVPATIKYVYIPLGDKQRPPDDFAEKFLNVIHQTGAPFIVHCQGGRHRTGIAIGIYRVHDCGWTYDQAKQEADKYTGLFGWAGHGMILDYLKDYAAKHAAKH